MMYRASGDNSSRVPIYLLDVFFLASAVVVETHVVVGDKFALLHYKRSNTLYPQSSSSVTSIISSSRKTTLDVSWAKNISLNYWPPTN